MFRTLESALPLLNMNRRFLESLINNEHVVLGRVLHPYSFNDVLILSIDESPFYTGAPVVPRWDDLAVAVEICSSPIEQFLRPSRKSIFASIMTLAAQYAWGWWIRRRYNLEEEFAKFIEYQKDFDQRPTFWTDDSGESGKTLKAPWVYSVACLIEAHSNMRHEEIMSAPIGLMLWKSATIAELFGYTKAEMESEEDMKAIEALKKEEEQN